MTQRGSERVTHKNPCPVCGGPKGCVLLETQVVCLRVSSEREVSGGLGGWYHPRLDQASTPSLVIPPPARPRTPKGSPDFLHEVYSWLLDQLELEHVDLRHLREVRRLTESQIQARGYRSWSALQKSSLAAAAWSRWGVKVCQVPGFFMRNERLQLSGFDGILIPVRGVEGRVLGLRIRPRDPKEQKSGKYRWLSGGPGGRGVSIGSPCHLSRPTGAPARANERRLWVSEGELKADISSDLLGELVLSLPGVDATGEFLPTLEQLRDQVDQVVIALDADWKTKPQVQKAREHLANLAAQAGFAVSLATWDGPKGLDDLLQAGGKPRLEPFSVRPGKRHVLEVEEPALTPRGPAPSTLEEVRKKRLRLFEDFLENKGGENGNKVLLDRTQAGTGKSYGLTQAVNEHHRKKRAGRVAVLVPRHELGKTEGRGGWNHVKGRTHGLATPGAQVPCAFPDQQNDLAQQRIPGLVGCKACRLREVCERNRQSEEGKPFYWSQFQRTERAIVLPVQHLSTPTVWENAAALVFDDCDLLALQVQEVDVPREDLLQALHRAEQAGDGYSPAQPFLRLLLEVLDLVDRGEPEKRSGVELVDLLRRQAVELGLTLREILEAARQAREPEPFGTGGIETGVTAPKRFIGDLVEVLLVELGRFEQAEERWNTRLYLEPVKRGSRMHRFRFLERRPIPVDRMAGKPIIILNASMTREEAQRLFPDRTIEVFEDPVRLPPSVRIIQHIGRGYGKVDLSRPQSIEELAQEWQRILTENRGKKAAFITHLPAKNALRKHLGEQPGLHFFNQRGSNELKDVDLLGILGTPNPNPEDLLEQAAALYWDGPVLQTHTFLENRSVSLTGGRKAQTQAYTYRDPRLRSLLEGRREQEILQAIYRARPLSAATAVQDDLFEAPQKVRLGVEIHVFSNLPIPGVEVELAGLNLVPARPRESTLEQLTEACLALLEAGIYPGEERLRESTGLPLRLIRQMKVEAHRNAEGELGRRRSLEVPLPPPHPERWAYPEEERLYHRFNKPVDTPQGPGILWQIQPGVARVRFDQVLLSFPVDQVHPPAPVPLVIPLEPSSFVQQAQAC